MRLHDCYRLDGAGLAGEELLQRGLQRRRPVLEAQHRIEGGAPDEHLRREGSVLAVGVVREGHARALLEELHRVAKRGAVRERVRERIAFYKRADGREDVLNAPLLLFCPRPRVEITEA